MAPTRSRIRTTSRRVLSMVASRFVPLGRDAPSHEQRREGTAVPAVWSSDGCAIRLGHVATAATRVSVATRGFFAARRAQTRMSLRSSGLRVRRLRRHELLALELRLEAVEHFVHRLPALELLHVVEPPGDVRIGREVVADQLAE